MNTCPITVRPGQILGHRRNGSPIFASAGASPDGDAAAAAVGTDGGQQGAGQTAAGTTGQQTAGSQQAAQTGGQQTAGQAAATQATAAEKVEDLPVWAQKIISDAREDAGKARTSAKEQAAQEAREELLKKLGLTKDGEEQPDPAELAKKLSDRDAELLTLKRETAAAKSARAAGADVDALLDSRTFGDKLAALDPAASTFTANLDALVKKTLTENPKLKAVQAAGASGGQFNGGTGEGRTRPTSLHGALAAATQP